MGVTWHYEAGQKPLFFLCNSLHLVRSMQDFKELLLIQDDVCIIDLPKWYVMAFFSWTRHQ